MATRRRLQKSNLNRRLLTESKKIEKEEKKIESEENPLKQRKKG